MKTYDFEMTQDGTTVAKGTASATMLYEFQKAFVETIGPTARGTKGAFLRLDQILAMQTGLYVCWNTTSADDKRFGFFCKRVN